MWKRIMILLQSCLLLLAIGIFSGCSDKRTISNESKPSEVISNADKPAKVTSNTEKPKDQFSGIVASTVIGEDVTIAVIGNAIVKGNYATYHEGDTIYGVKIVKIYTDRVDFEKSGKRWTQRVVESPNPAWQE
jgi:type II secretory pathway component PulC